MRELGGKVDKEEMVGIIFRESKGERRKKPTHLHFMPLRIDILQ